MRKLEFNFVHEKDKEKLITQLQDRGLEYSEANFITEILHNAERYKTEKFTRTAQLTVLRGLIESGEHLMATQGGKAGIFYGEIKKKINELEEQNAMRS